MTARSSEQKSSWDKLDVMASDALRTSSSPTAPRSCHVVLAGGGTAGHVNPLLSVAAAIRRLDPVAVISVIGTQAGLESRLVPQAGYPLDVIDKLPFPRRPNLAALRFPHAWRREKRLVQTTLAARHANVVVGFGGYASAPVYAAAHRMGIPIAVHEQNAKAGMANRLGSQWAQYIGTVYRRTGLHARPGAQIERVGLPLRPAIAQLCTRMTKDRAATRRACAQRLGVDPTRPVIVVTGGSLGAQRLNEAMAASSRQLLRRAQVIHLTGAGKLSEVRALVSRTAGSKALAGLFTHGGGGDYHVSEYLERIDLAFGCADLVVCRAGAGTVAELSALGIPAIYVPLPIGNGEQRYNAQPLVNAGGGRMVADADFISDWVTSHVPQLLADRQTLASIGRAAWSYGIRDAAGTMARRILALAGVRS